MAYRFTDNARQGHSENPKKVFFLDKQTRTLCSATVPDLASAGMVLIARASPDRSWATLPAQCLVEWLTRRVRDERKRGKGYVKNVVARLKHFVAAFEDCPFGEIRQADLSDFNISLGDESRVKPLRPPTITAICHTVDMLFREAVEEDIIPGPPPTERAFANMARSFRAKTIRYPEEDERQALLRTEDRVALFVSTLLLYAAMREDEISALSLDDIKRDTIEITRVRLLDGSLGAPGNSERIRSIPQDPRIRRYLRQLGWLGLDRAQPIIEQLVPPKTLIKQHLVGSTFRRHQVWCGVVNEAGAAKFTPREAAHSTIISWLSGSHDLDQLRRAVGMASVERLLETYSRWILNEDDVGLFDDADAELTAELSAERCAHDSE